MDYKQALCKIKELQKAIWEAQEKAKNLTDITKSLETQIFRVAKDKKGKYIAVFSEGQIAEKFKITTADVMGKTVSSIFGESLYQELKPFYDKAFKGETAHYRGFLFRKRYFSTILTPFSYDTDGTVLEVSGITQDINELYDTEKKYKEMTEVLNNIIEYNPYSIQICDSDGYQIKYNNAFLNIFKSSPSKEWSLFNDPMLKQSGLFEEILKVKDGKIVEIPEIWYNSHDVDPKYPDNLVCLRAIHFPIFNAKHELENVILMHEDITSKMSLKKRVRELEEFHDLAGGRELLMKNMEKELEELKTKLKNRNNPN
jgi:transcriptional regulator with PAS, ATPase and Fis domain